MDFFFFFVTAKQGKFKKIYRLDNLKAINLREHHGDHSSEKVGRRGCSILSRNNYAMLSTANL